MKQKKIIPFFLILVLLYFPCNGFSTFYIASYDEDGQKPVYNVQWVRSFKSTEQIVKNNSIFSKLHELIFGAINTKLARPVAVLTQASDKMIILDASRQSLIEWNLLSGKSNYVGGFPSPVSICTFEDDKILFTDSALEGIFEKSLVTNITKKLTTLTKLKRPVGIAYLTSKQQIWVAESGLHQITVLSSVGKVIRKIGKRGTKEGSFNFPTYIWIDENELIYVVDSMNFRVQIFDSSGKLVNVFGKPGDSSGYFSRPKGIATDSFGNIYVADALFHTIQIFNQAGQFLHSFGQQGRDDGEFWMPAGIFIDKQDHIFVADKFNSRIQEFELIQRDFDEE